MRKLIKKSVAAALSTALLVTLGPVADISTVKAADDYTYLYAGLTWDQYWDAENIYLQSDKAMTDSNTEADARGEMDKGAFDAVSRATTNHGLHRGSYQCDAVIYGEDGSEFNVSHWSADGKTLYLTDGTDVCFNGCKACTNKCPVHLKYDEAGMREGECISCGRCFMVCPHRMKKK